MKEFKIRASKASVLLTAGGKTSVAQTPKNYFEEWLISNITGKHKVIDSKYLRRGIESEEFAIARVGKDLIKNKQYFENDYFIGTPDVITEDTVIDAKCSWDAFTFPLFMKDPPIQYVAQLQVYMNLTGKRKAILAYCLENGTMEQINSLAWKKAKDDGADEPKIDHWDTAESELNYDNLSPELRIKKFEIEYDEDMINNLIEGVKFGREYIKNELLTQIKL